MDASLGKLLEGLVEAACMHAAAVEEVLARLLSALGVERITVLGYSQETRRFITLHHAGAPGIAAAPEALEASLWPRAVAALQHEGFRYEQAAQVPEEDRRAVAALGARSLLGVPLSLGAVPPDNGALGYVLFEVFAAERRFEAELEWFRAAARIVSAALERQRERAAAEGRAARSQYELGELLGAFLGHDLRNPLSAINGLTQLVLRREGLPEEVVRRVGAIESAAQRTNRWLDTLLTFLESNGPAGLHLTKTSLDLRELVSRVVREQQNTRGDRVIALEPSTPIVGTWDPARLAQLVGHVLANAQSSSDGSAPVRVELGKDGGAAVLTVTSTGPALSPAALASLFDPMGPRESPELMRPRSLRLGLHMGRRIAQGHGGSLDVESQGASTVFTVRLPTGAR